MTPVSTHKEQIFTATHYTSLPHSIAKNYADVSTLMGILRAVAVETLLLTTKSGRRYICDVCDTTNFIACTSSSPSSLVAFQFPDRLRTWGRSGNEATTIIMQPRYCKFNNCRRIDNEIVCKSLSSKFDSIHFFCPEITPEKPRDNAQL